MCEEEIDLNEHWSYTIMGNWRAKHFYQDFFFICWELKTVEEKGQLPEDMSDSEFIESMRVLIDRGYSKLVDFVQKQKSRLAYLVLGWFLMFFGGKMSREVKKQIIEYSEWDCEKFQFNTEEEKKLRKKYLSEFREKIINYREGIPTHVTEETLSDIYNNDGPWNLTPINYSI